MKREDIQKVNQALKRAGIKKAVITKLYAMFDGPDTPLASKRSSQPGYDITPKGHQRRTK